VLDVDRVAVEDLSRPDAMDPKPKKLGGGGGLKRTVIRRGKSLLALSDDQEEQLQA
jgi:hypothetical protein